MEDQSMVKRIDVLLFDGEPSVSCVRAADYDALAAERDKLEDDIMEIHPRMVTAEVRVRELEAELANYKGAIDALQARIAVLKTTLRDLLALADISQPSPDLVPGVVRRSRAVVDAWFGEQDRLPTDTGGKEQ
jgi:hypothetical protein